MPVYPQHCMREEVTMDKFITAVAIAIAFAYVIVLESAFGAGISFLGPISASL
jgi:hypothetical protein